MKGLNPFHIMGLTILWLLVIGPLWLVGWGVMRIARRTHMIAQAWCRLCMWLLP